MRYDTVKLYLYKNSGFYPHQSYKIEDMESYLSKKCVLFNTSAFEIRIVRPFEFTMEVKVDIPQDRFLYNDNISSVIEYNYAKISITDDNITNNVYYYVNKHEWISSHCIKLYLQMDTLNSFLDRLEFMPNCMVEREHIDRFRVDDLFVETTIAYVYSYFRTFRNISLKTEGLNYTLTNYSFLCNKSDVEDVEYDDIDEERKEWFYYTSNIVGYPIIILGNDKLSWIAYTKWERNETTYSGKTQLFFLPLSNYGDNYYKNTSQPLQSTRTFDLSRTDITKINIIPYSPLGVFQSTTSRKEYNDDPEGLGNWKYSLYSASEKAILIGIGSTEQTADSSFLTHLGDRDDDVVYDDYKNVRYCKKLTGKDGSGYNLSPKSYIVQVGNWRHCKEELSSDFLRNEVKCNTVDTLNELLYPSITIGQYGRHGDFELTNKFEEDLIAGEIENRTIKFYVYDICEAQTFHSEFFKAVFNYLDYKFEVNLEDLDYYKYISEFSPIVISFIVGENLSNSFAFLFEFYGVKDIGIANNQYIINVKINNEVSLVNDEYLNYMRNGYNYDVKNNQLQHEKTFEKLTDQYVVDAVSSVGNITNPVQAIKTAYDYTFNKPLQLAVDYKQLQYDDMIKQNQLEKGIAERKASRVSQNSNDSESIFNLNPYNKLQFYVNFVDREKARQLDDYFYHFGVPINEYKTPNTTGRYYFNYVRGRIDFKNRNAVSTIDALKDIIDRFSKGVYYIHKVGTGNSTNWFFNYDYKENVELSLINAIRQLNKKSKHKEK